jgi:aminoglycoside phosphotransferase (APT) family kinase protein
VTIVITPELVSRLVAVQFPQWANLAVAPVDLDGNDNTTFRLGDGFSVRLPSADAYVSQVDKEQRWLPFLAPRLPLPIPEPVARGVPALGFPRPWSVYRWRSGELATAERVLDETRFATELAGFLAVLYAIDPTGGPAAGAHSFFRGGPLDALDADARQAIAALADELDFQAAMTVWEAALATVWMRPPVWVHGDVTNSNLLVQDGRLCAVLDFGCSAVGDPACDLAIAWTYFRGESREAFRAGLAFDDGTWARGRGWALWKALITRAQVVQGGTNAVDAAGRFGWPRCSRATLDEVLANG